MDISWDKVGKVGVGGGVPVVVVYLLFNLLSTTIESKASTDSLTTLETRITTVKSDLTEIVKKKVDLAQLETVSSQIEDYKESVSAQIEDYKDDIERLETEQKEQGKQLRSVETRQEEILRGQQRILDVLERQNERDD